MLSILYCLEFMSTARDSLQMVAKNILGYTMAKAINDDICIIGSTLVIGVKFPKIDGIYSFSELLQSNSIEVQYYIINTNKKYKVTELYHVLEEGDKDYDNMYAFTIDTTNLTPGVLMVEATAIIPAHNALPKRTEIARCSTGIAIIK